MLIVLPGSSGDISLNISDYWADQGGIGIKGWVSAIAGPPDLEFICDRVVVPITSWHRRDDIAEKAPAAFRGHAWGFWCYLPSNSTPSITIRRRGAPLRQAETVSLKKHPLKVSPSPQVEMGALFEEFRAEVNRKAGKILEIGSRQVVPGGQSKRSLFPDCSYVGFDYYSDVNTNVVGDAHELSKFFGDEFDAVFSLAVLEHLAMPWVVAAEINKVLKPGGLTFHSSHFAFPLHERPWDFWRYTDQSLRVLFSPPLGFEIIRCAFDTPARMHPDVPRDDLMHLPLEPVWVGVSVLARKIAPLDPSKFKWDASVAECLGGDSHYPAPKLAADRPAKRDEAV
jgi:SAM-dependent methyltransferase